MTSIPNTPAHDVAHGGDTPTELPRRFATITRDMVKAAERVTRSKGKVVAIRTADAFIVDENVVGSYSPNLRSLAARVGVTLPHCAEPGCTSDHIGDGLDEDIWHHLDTAAVQVRTEWDTRRDVRPCYMWAEDGGSIYLDDGNQMGLTLEAAETLVAELQKVLEVARRHPQAAW